jgi:hypothetical protein
LRRVVAQLEGMPAAERLRWLELLSYIHALVYHERNPAEHEGLQGEIEASVRTDEHRQEVSTMRRTIADELRAQGRKEEAVRSRRQTLLRQLRRRLGESPAEAVAAVEAANSVKQLNGWLDGVVTAARLADIGIRLPSSCRGEDHDGAGVAGLHRPAGDTGVPAGQNQRSKVAASCYRVRSPGLEG